MKMESRTSCLELKVQWYTESTMSKREDDYVCYLNLSIRGSKRELRVGKSRCSCVKKNSPFPVWNLPWWLIRRTHNSHTSPSQQQELAVNTLRPVSSTFSDLGPTFNQTCIWGPILSHIYLHGGSASVVTHLGSDHDPLVAPNPPVMTCYLEHPALTQGNMFSEQGSWELMIQSIRRALG